MPQTQFTFGRTLSSVYSGKKQAERDAVMEQAQRFAQNLNTARQNTDAEIEKYVTLGQEMVAAGGDPAKVRDAMTKVAESYATQLAELQGQAQRNGIDPTQFPSAQGYIEQAQTLFDNAIGIAAQQRQATETAAAEAAEAERKKAELAQRTPAMKQAEAIGLKPGTDEYKDFLRRDEERQASINDLVIPILTKMQNEEELSAGEQKVLDVYTRASMEERMMAALFGDVSFLTGGLDNPDADLDEPDQGPPTPRAPGNKEDILTAAILDLGGLQGAERDEAVKRYVEIANDMHGVDLTAEELTTLLDQFPRGRPGPGPHPINRP